MSDMQEITGLVEKLGTGFEAMQARLDEVHKRTARFADADIVEREAVDRIAKDVADLKAQVEVAERKANAASRAAPGGSDSAAAQETRAAFDRALRRKAAWAELEAKAVDAAYSSNSTSGGVAVPEIIATEILRKAIDLSPMRGIVRVTQVGSPNYERLVNVRGTGYEWVGETTTRSTTATPTIERVTFTHGEISAVASASNWSLNDLMFDVSAWLSEEISQHFALGEGVAIVSGNGTNKPTGFLNGSPSSAGDDDSPARAFGTLQYLPTGKAGAFDNDLLTSPAGDPLAVFINAYAALKPAYHGNARFVMNRATFAELLKKRDADGRPLIHWDTTGGVPMNILGYPITIMDAMPDIGSNTFPVAFGDFYAGYELLDIVGMTLIRDDVTSKGSTLFYMSRRLGGKVVNDDAIKLIKCAAS